MTISFPPSATFCVIYMKFGKDFNLKNCSAGFSFLTHFHSSSHNWRNIVKKMCLSLFFYLLFYQGELHHIFPQKVFKFRKIRYGRRHIELQAPWSFILFYFFHCPSWTTNWYKKFSQKFISDCVFLERSNTVFCLSILKYYFDYSTIHDAGTSPNKDTECFWTHYIPMGPNIIWSIMNIYCQNLA